MYKRISVWREHTIWSERSSDNFRQFPYSLYIPQYSFFQSRHVLVSRLEQVWTPSFGYFERHVDGGGGGGIWVIEKLRRSERCSYRSVQCRAARSARGNCPGAYLHLTPKCSYAGLTCRVSGLLGLQIYKEPIEPSTRLPFNWLSLSSLHMS